MSDYNAQTPVKDLMRRWGLRAHRLGSQDRFVALERQATRAELSQWSIVPQGFKRLCPGLRGVMYDTLPVVKCQAALDRAVSPIYGFSMGAGRARTVASATVDISRAQGARC